MRVLRISAVAVSVLLLTGCSSDDDADNAGPDAAPGPTATANAPTGDDVALEFDVEDCEGCVITAYSTRTPGEPKTWPAPPVSGGTTELTVPQAETEAMSFDVSGGEGRTDLGYYNARPAVVLAERGSGADREANWCWQGADRPVTMMRVEHTTVPVPAEERGAGGDTAHVFRADPPQRVVDGQWQPTEDGGLGHQDAPYCDQGASPARTAT